MLENDRDAIVRVTLSSICTAICIFGGLLKNGLRIENVEEAMPPEDLRADMP